MTVIEKFQITMFLIFNTALIGGPWVVFLAVYQDHSPVWMKSKITDGDELLPEMERHLTEVFPVCVTEEKGRVLRVRSVICSLPWVEQYLDPWVGAMEDQGFCKFECVGASHVIHTDLRCEK